jgi:hypothetical protein
MKIVDVVALGTVLSLLSCAEAPPPRSPPAALSVAGVRSTCPLGVSNAHVTFDETATGAALTFTAAPEQLAELRTRVRDASAMHGTGKHLGEGHQGKHGLGGRRHGIAPAQLPPAHAGVEETAEGARVSFTPSDPKDLDALRAHLKVRTENLMRSCE